MSIETNAQLLEQAAEVLRGVDDAAYSRPVEFLGGQRIGGHARHVANFYEQLIAGLADGRINYDARRRDPVIESNRAAAVRRLLTLASVIRDDRRLRGNRIVWVAGESVGYAESSVARELQAALSHTVHHFALIAVLARCQGIPVPADFGVSKSTLDFRASRRREVA